MSQELTESAQAVAEAPNLLDEIIEASKLSPDDEGYSITRAGLQAFLKEIVEIKPEAKISSSLVDDMINEIDAKLSLQLNAIMHGQEFRKLESSWRSLKYLVDKTDFRENNKIEIINVSKEDLLADFEDAPEVVKSGLYK
ncbi:MAG: type VI secretion system contractile sheath large subunit, partial [Desulfovibrio sp.]|nr:type VI secretion system contractile sheath large subunit [Desulfovibrio sp.]